LSFFFLNSLFLVSTFFNQHTLCVWSKKLKKRQNKKNLRRKKTT
jgi:hypothetical protein